MKKNICLLFAFAVIAANIFAVTVDEYISAVEEYFYQNKFEEALVILEEAKRVFPENAMLHQITGDMHYRLGRIALALEYSFRATELDPSLVDAHSFRFLVFRSLHNYEEALRHINRALQLEPENAILYHTRGLFFDQLGWFDLALADLNRAIEISPSSVSFHERGAIYATLGNIERALADFNEAVRLDSESMRSLNARGTALFVLGRHDESLADFDTVIRLDSNNFSGYFNRGAANLNLDRLDEALRDFTRAIEIDPYERQSFQFRSVVYEFLAEQASDPEQAQRYLQLAQEDEAMADRLETGGGDDPTPFVRVALEGM
ncbi:MAG: tetratricopeptide repeat protein [Treponema sp.]|nr:tetratricopeptide repeat protein [Treponema sp.]